MRYTATYSNGWTFVGNPGQSLAVVREKASNAFAATSLRVIAVIGSREHLVTVTLDATGYGSDTWACTCGARNTADFGGFRPYEDHITDGSEPAITYPLSEED